MDGRILATVGLDCIGELVANVIHSQNNNSKGGRSAREEQSCVFQNLWQ